MRARAPWLFVSPLLLAACSSKPPAGGPGAATVEVPNADAGCARAATLLADAPKLRAEGKLDRAYRTLQRVESSCPARASEPWADRLSIAAELGLRAEGLALAEKVEKASGASTAAKQAATALRKAFESPPPDGNALIEQGIRELSAGHPVEAQRALDRGRVALEAAKGKTMVVVSQGTLEGAIAGTTFQDDGSALAFMHGRSVTVVPMDPEKPIRTFRGHEERVTSVTWMSGARLASASADGAVLVWNTTTSTIEKRLHVVRGETQIAVAQGDRYLAAGAREGKKLAVFRLADDAKIVDVAEEGLLDLGFVQGREEVWISTPLRYLWRDLKTGKVTHETGATDSPQILAPNGRDIAVIQNEHELRIARDYGASQGPILAQATGCDAHIFPSFFTPDAKTLVIRVANGAALSLAMPGGKSRWERKGLSERATISPDAKLYADIGPDSIDIHDALKGTVIASEKGVHHRIESLRFSPDGKHLVAFEGRSGLTIFRTENLARVRKIGHDHGEIRAARASADKLVMAAAHTMVGIVANDPKRVWTAAVEARSASIDEGASRVVTDDGEQVKVWAVGDPSPKATWKVSAYHRLLPSADGVAVNDESGSTFTLRSSGAPDRPIRALWHRSALSADGKLVVGVGDEDGRVGVWDAMTGALKCQFGASLTKRDPWPEDVMTSRDGSFVAVMWKDELKVYRGCDASKVTTIKTGWNGRPAGTSGMTDDGKSLHFYADVGPELHVWDVDKGTHEKRRFDDISRFSLGPSGHLLLWSNNKTLLLDRLGEEPKALTFQGVSSASWTSRYMVLGTEDGRVVLASARDGKPVAEVMPIGEGRAMLVTTETGAFEAFGDAGSWLGCELDGVPYRFEVCRERLEQPGLLGRVLRGEELDTP